MSGKSSSDLGQGNIFRLVMTFGLPAVIGLLINASYNFVDRIFVGNGVGAVGLGAIAVCFPCFVLQIALSMLAGVGGGVNFAVSLGQKRQFKAEYIMANAFMFVFGLGIVFVAVHAAFLRPLLRLYGAPDDLMSAAVDYQRVLLFGTPFFMATGAMNNFIRASGYPRTAMLTMLIGAVSNTVFDWLFIFKLKYGIAGAAAATVIAQLLSFCWTILFFIRTCPYRFKIRYAVPNPKIIAIVVSVGTAPFLIQICNGFVQTVFNRTLTQYGGSLAVSVMGVTMATVMLMFMPGIGFCEGAQPIIGYNLGARKYKRVIKTYRTLILITTFIFSAAWLFLQFGSENVMRLFDPNNAEFIAVGSSALKIVGLTFPFVGFQLTTTYFLQGTKNPRMASFLSISRQLLFLAPFIVFLPKYMGVEGVFYSLPCSDFAAFLIAVPIYLHQVSKYKKAARAENGI